jgi:hypothetical protein
LSSQKYGANFRKILKTRNTIAQKTLKMTKIGQKEPTPFSDFSFFELERQ